MEIKITSAEVQTLFSVFLKERSNSLRLVGGSVRNLLLNKPITDYDFATIFRPEETITILEKSGIRAIPTGIKFGTITAVLNHHSFEITTLRQDLNPDGRHATTEFVDDYLLDAKRRDFTINALYSDETGKVYDYFEGIADLKEKRVRFIGDPVARIQEDYLRILRFFRFSCYYAKEIDEKGLAACAKLKSGIAKLSAERIWAELAKILACEDKSKLLATLIAMENSGVGFEVFSFPLQLKIFSNLLKIENEANSMLRLAALASPENFAKISAKLKISNQQKKYLKFLADSLAAIKKSNKPQPIQLKILLAFHPQELVTDFYLIACALDYFKFQDSDLALLKNFANPEFPLKAEDLMKRGLEGEKIGLELKRARILWAKNDFKLNKTEILSALLN